MKTHCSLSLKYTAAEESGFDVDLLENAAFFSPDYEQVCIGICALPLNQKDWRTEEDEPSLVISHSTVRVTEKEKKKKRELQ